MSSCAVGSFAASAGYGFIYDDYWTVVGNSHLERPIAELLRGALSGRNVALQVPDATRPMMTVSLWVDRALFGLEPAGYHAHSLLLYAAVCVAGMLLGFAVLRSVRRASHVGLAFAAMPLHAEVVASINYREDLQAALGVFVACTVAFWPGPRTAFRAPVIALAWLFALLSKESALAAPLMVGALHLVRPLPRRFVEPSSRLWPWVVGVSLLWLSWRFGVSVLGEQIPRATPAGLSQTLLATARYLGQVLLSCVAPFWATPEYDPLGPAAGWWALCFPMLALVGWLGWRRRSLRPALAFSAFALAAAVVSSPLVGPINERADRYFFAASLGTALWVAMGIDRLGLSGPRAKLGLVSALCLLLVASRVATRVWSSEAELWTAAVRAAPASPRAWSQLGRVHRLAGHAELAEWAVAESLKRDPNYVPGRIAAVLNRLWVGDREGGRMRLLDVNVETELHASGFRLAKRCADAQSSRAAERCARLAVPPGTVIGDAGRLRDFSRELRARSAAQ